MSLMHVNLASYNVKQEPASQSGPATGPFAEPPWHERTSSAIVARTSVTELRRLSAAVAGAESGAALHLQRLCDLLRAKLAVSFACVDVFGSQRPCSCTLAASGCAESHLPLGMPRLHTPADAAELRVLLPPLGPGPGHTSYSHLSASTLLGATTLSAHSAAANTPSCGGGNRSNPTSPGGGLPTSNGAGGAAASGTFPGRRACGATAQMCPSPSMVSGGGGAVVMNPLAAPDRERWLHHHHSRSHFDRWSAGSERPSAGGAAGVAAGDRSSAAAAAFWGGAAGGDRSSTAGDRPSGGSPRGGTGGGYFASPRAVIAAASAASAGGAYPAGCGACNGCVGGAGGGGFSCATSLEALPRHIRRLADQFDSELRSFWVLPLFAPGPAAAAPGCSVPGSPLVPLPAAAAIASPPSPLLRPYSCGPASGASSLPRCLQSPGRTAGAGVGFGVGSPIPSPGGGAAAHMLQQLPLMPETPGFGAVHGAAGATLAAGGGGGRRVVGLLYLMSCDELLFQLPREPLDQYCRWLSDAVSEGRLELLADMADALTHAAGPGAAAAAAAAHLSDFFTHRTQGMAEVLAYPAFLPTDCPDRAVLVLPPAAHSLVPPSAAPSAPATAAQADPGAATAAAAGGAVVGGGLARSVAEAAAEADVGDGDGEASGLTSGDVMDTWGGVEGLGFLHGSPYTAGGGTCAHGAGGLGGGRSRAAGGAGRAPPLQPFSLPLHGTLLQSSLALGGRSRAQPVRVHGGGGGGGGSTTAAAGAAAGGAAAGGAGAASPPAGAAAVTTAAAAAAATAAAAAAIARLPDHVLYGGRDGLYGSAPAKTGPAGPLAAVRGLGPPGAPPAAAARHRRVSDAAAAAAAMSHADVALLPGAPQFVMVGVLRDPAAPPPPPVPLLRAASAAGGSSGGGRDAAAAAVAASAAAAATGGRFALYLSVSESLRKDLVRELQSTLDALLVLLHPVFVSAFGYGGAAAAAAAGTSAPAPAGTLGALAGGRGDPAASSRQRLAAYLATARVVG